MMNSNFLKNDWMISGQTLESFQKAVKELSEATEHRLMDPRGCAVMPMFRETNGFYTCSVFRNKTMEGIYNTIHKYDPKTAADKDGIGLSLIACPAERLDEELAAESMQTNGMIFSVDGKAHYISADARSQMLDRIGLGGSRFAECNLFTSGCIADALFAYTEDLILAIRKDNAGNRKIFGVLSAKYQPVPQSVLPTVIGRILADKTLGNAEVKGWNIDHAYTRLYIEFPEAAEDFAATYKLDEKNIPGIIVMSSDTGNCSVTVQGTYRKPGSNHYSIVNGISRRHFGEIEPEQIIKACDDEVIAELRKLPEALADKIGSVIGDGNTATHHERAKNGAAVRRAIRHGMKELGIRKELANSKARLKALEEALCAEVDDSIVYTEYDLAQLFLGLPGRLEGLGQVRKDRIARCCGRAPFISFNPKQKADDNEGLTLLPEEQS